MEKSQCPVCGSNKVIFNEERDELICRDCGNIQTEGA